MRVLERREIWSNATKLKWKNPSYRRKMVIACRKAAKRRWKDKAIRDKYIRGCRIGSKKRWTEQEREKASSRMKVLWKNPLGSHRRSVWKWAYGAKAKTEGTTIEVLLRNALTKVGIKFTANPKMFGLPDIYINPNICVFCDGEYWHSFPNRIKRDRKVRRILNKHKYKVIRFKGKTIKNKINFCVAMIRRIMEVAA